MQPVLEFLKSLYNAGRLLDLVRGLLSSSIGLAGLAGIIFAETGLLAGVFLPGDSLLFSVGVASGAAGINIYLVCGMLLAAAILGDNLGYYLGFQTGPRIFSRPKSRFFHPDQIQRTRQFYQKYGVRAIMYARFIPIVRSCTPFIAGVARMPYLKFLTFSLLGGVLWIATITMLGCQLGQVEIVRKNFEKVVLGIILLSLSPVVWETVKARRAKSAG
jgi:membrane-associated protein